MAGTKELTHLPGKGRRRGWKLKVDIFNLGTRYTFSRHMQLKALAQISKGRGVPSTFGVFRWGLGSFTEDTQESTSVVQS